MLFIASFPVFPEQTRVIHDPFAKPELTKLTEPTTDLGMPETALSEHQLSSTLRAGKNSMIIVDGRVIRLGEKFNGYKLIAVHERAAIFLKNQKQSRLTLDNNE